MQNFKRWIIIYKHDESPVETLNCFIHKSQALKERDKHTLDNSKLNVIKMNMQSYVEKC